MRGRVGARTCKWVTVGALVTVGFGLALPTFAGAEECVVGVIVCSEPAPEPTNPTPPPSTTTTTAPPPPNPAQAAARLLQLLNDERAKAGLTPFTMRGDVTEIAQGWSATMADQGTLSHNDQYFTRETQERLDAGFMGENVGYAADIDRAHRALMDSPSHRHNILDARFTVIGLGAVYKKGSWWVTEDFLQPSGSSAPSAPAPAPAAPAPAAPTANSAAPKPKADGEVARDDDAPAADTGTVRAASSPVDVLAASSSPVEADEAAIGDAGTSAAGVGLLAGESLPQRRLGFGVVSIALVLMAASAVVRAARRRVGVVS